MINMTKVKKIAKYTGLGFLALILIALLLNTVLSCVASKQLEKELSQIKESGGVLTLAELAPPPVPDEENAALIYQKAFALLSLDKLSSDEEKAWDKISNNIQEWTETDRIILKGMLTRNEYVLSFLEEAAIFAKSRFPMDYSNPLNAIPQDLMNIKRAAYLLAAKARFELLEGKPDEALKTCFVGFRLAKARISEPILVSQMVQVASTKVILNTLEKVMDQNEGDIGMYTTLLKELNIQEYRDAFTRSMEGERCLGIYAYDSVFNSVENLKQYDLVRRKISFPTKVWYSFALFISRPFRTKDEIYCLKLTKELIFLSKLLYYEAKPKFESIKNEIPAPSLSHLDVNWFCPSRSSLPVLVHGSSLDKQACYEAWVGAGRLALSLRIYNLQKGLYPDSLSALVPDIIPELSKDPFTGKDYIYKKEGDGFIVYSLGENLKDDGGVVEEDKDKGDIVWRCRQ
ncbi:hypothetical protein ACFL5I_01635 [Planctomycetota bacterium]